MWNPFKTEEPELTPEEERNMRVTQVDVQLRQAQAMFNMFIDSLDAVVDDIEQNKNSCEAEISYHESQIAAEKSIKNRLERRESEAQKVMSNVKKNFTINLDGVDEEEDSAES